MCDLLENNKVINSTFLFRCIKMLIFLFPHAGHVKTFLIRFQLRYEEDIEFNKLGLRDNVAQICVLEVCYGIGSSL
jgi:hypothetical protein